MIQAVAHCISPAAARATDNEIYATLSGAKIRHCLASGDQTFGLMQLRLTVLLLGHTGTTLHSHADHRLAMAWGVLSLVATGETRIADAWGGGRVVSGVWETLARIEN